MNITAYRIIKSSSSDCIFQFSKSSSAKAAMIKNWINPKKHVNEVRVSFAGYFFTTGACTKFFSFTIQVTKLVILRKLSKFHEHMSGHNKLQYILYGYVYLNYEINILVI